MIDFICANSITIAIICIIIIAIIILAYMNRKDVLKKAALYAVAKAEEAWGSKTGQIKFAEVYSFLRTKYPIITFFVTEKTLTNIIEKALVTLKEIISNQKEVKS